MLNFCVCAFASQNTFQETEAPKLNTEILVKGKMASPQSLLNTAIDICKKIKAPEKEMGLIFFASMLGYPDFTGVDDKPIQFALLKNNKEIQLIFSISAQKNSLLARQLLNMSVGKFENSHIILAFGNIKKTIEILPYSFAETTLNGIFEIEGTPEEILKISKTPILEEIKKHFKDVKKIKISCAIKSDTATIRTEIFAKNKSAIASLQESIQQVLKATRTNSKIEIKDDICIVKTQIKFSELEKQVMSTIENIFPKGALNEK